MQYGIWLPFAVVGYVLWTLWANRREGRWLRLIGWGGAAVALMAVLAWVYPLAALRQINLDPNEFPPAGMNTLHAYSLPLSALVGLAPSEDTKTLGHVLVWLIWGGIGVALLARFRQGRQAVVAGDLPSELTPTAPVSRPYPGQWFWLIMALGPLVMALGPDITIGDTVIPLPYLLLHNALHGQYRVPS
ncbi:MAG TPA: hypothetical protein VHO69_00755, partial [Phototrophicaceae bacterium]|nr:hypothetical protein [Phototrophicaceae bacterium]